MMKRRGWESLNADMMDLRERAEKNAKLTNAWAEHAAECQRVCNDSQAYIKNLEADLERVRAELVEYKRMYADEVEKRVSFAVLLKEGEKLQEPPKEEANERTDKHGDARALRVLPIPI